jgi:hypothetical protein
MVNLFVAWFQSQRGGRTQPHSPKVCLPGAGWTAEDSGEIQIQTPAESIPANRLVASNLGQRAVVLYWYQTPRRVLAGEWESKFWLIPDALRDHRTDTALVRVVVWTGKGQEAEATETGSNSRAVRVPYYGNFCRAKERYWTPTKSMPPLLGSFISGYWQRLQPMDLCNWPASCLE